MDNSLLLGELELLLGKGKKTSRENYSFHCPFCNHSKRKLEVDLHTTPEGKNYFQCWVCSTRGTTIKSLLYQLKVPKDKSREILKYVKEGEEDSYYQVNTLELPEEYQPLSTSSSTSVISKRIRQYLYNRGLTDEEILRYDPSVSRDIIMFENMINWNQPVVLVEGVFDSFSVKRNSIPILGKTLSKTLQKKLLTSPLQDIYIALDNDARKEAISHSKKLIEMGKNVFLVELNEKDPSEMGFTKFTKLIQTAQPLTLSSLLKYKLQ